MNRPLKGDFNFQDACQKMLVLAGASSGQPLSYPLVLDTIAGRLQCAPYESWLACRFESVDRAKQMIGRGNLNPFSGKWNWHYEGPTANDLIDLQGVIAEVASLKTEQQEIVDGFVQSLALCGNQSVDVLVRYRYRDGSNYKTERETCFSGPCVSAGDIKAMVLAMDGTEGSPSFIPGLVGLADLQDSFGGCESQWDPERDHPWHEFLSVKVVPSVDDQACEDVAFADFVQTVRNRGLIAGWDEDYLPPFHSEMAARYERAQRDSLRNVA